jgi:cholesterol transport system auxiliary component
MSGPAVRVIRRWVAVAAVITLACCASLFVANSPGHLYRLSADSVYPAALPRVTAQLLVDLPQAPTGIDTNRIALSQSPLSLDYYADSEWTDQVPGLVQTLLLASFENSRAITAVDRESVGLRADFVLKTEIRHFEAVGNGTGHPPNIWVAMIARLVTMPQREIIAQASFERHVPAAAADVPAVVAAFNAAADAVTRDIVIWTITNPTLSRKHR